MSRTVTFEFAEVVTLALLLPVVLYISTFIHELGHAVVGRAVGLVVTSFGLGTGRPFFLVNVGGIRIYLGRERPFQGLAFAVSPDLYMTSRQHAAYSAGGILANGLTALLAFAHWKSSFPGAKLAGLTSGVNGLSAVVSLIPFRMAIGRATFRTDGAQILDALRSRLTETTPPVHFQVVALLRGLWESIGDRRCLRVYLLASANHWLVLEDDERVVTVLDEADRVADPSWPLGDAQAAWLRAELALRERRLDEAARRFEDARRQFAAIGRDVSRFLDSFLGMRLRMIEGDFHAAAAELEALSDHIAVHRYRELKQILLASRLPISLVAGDVASAKSILADLDAARRGQPSMSSDLSVYRELGRFYAGQSNWPDALVAYHRSLAAARNLAASWANEDDRNRFIERHSIIVSETRACLDALGQHDEAERLTALLLSPDELKQANDETKRAAAEAAAMRDRRLRKIGLRLTLVNMGIAVVPVVLYFAFGLNVGATIGALAINLGSGTVTGSVVVLALYGMRKLVPALQVNFGAWILLFASAPWVMALVTGLAGMPGE